jgi:hypothetical protein
MGYGDGQAAAHLAEHLLHGAHHALGDARVVQHVAHEDEHGNGHKDPVVHQLVDPVAYHAHNHEVKPNICVKIQVAELRDQCEQDRHPTQDKGDGKPGE